MAKKKADDISVADLDNVTDDEIFANHAEGVEVEPPLPEDHESEPVVEVKVEAPVIVEPPKAAEQDTMAQMAYELREQKRQLAELQKPKEAPAPKAPEPEIPDPALDPIGYMAWEIADIKRQNKELLEWRQQTTEKTEAQTREDALTTSLQSAESQFKATTPDYDDVVTHMIKDMAAGVRKAAPTATSEQIAQYVQGQVKAIGAQALQAGKNPGAELYRMSKELYGYQPPTEEPPQRGKPSLEVIDKNKRRSGNGLGTGTGRKNLPSAEEFAAMSIKDMNKFTQEEQDEIIPSYG